MGGISRNSKVKNTIAENLSERKRERGGGGSCSISSIL